MKNLYQLLDIENNPFIAYHSQIERQTKDIN